MSLIWKTAVILILSVTIFGGGSYAAYELFFKKPAYQYVKPAKNATPIPTPDAGVALYQRGVELIDQGKVDDGKRLLISLFSSFPTSAKADEARQRVSDMNVRDFFSREPGGERREYTVGRGDSIARIANKTKATPELIFKANGLESLAIQPGRRLIIPSGSFALLLTIKQRSLILLNKNAFFKWYRVLEFKVPPSTTPGQYKIIGKEAWSSGQQVVFGTKNYLGSSRWLMVNQGGVTLYSETNLANPNVPKPRAGVQIASDDMEELYSLVAKETPVIIQ